MVGNNTPIFFVRDPQKFQDFIHSQKTPGRQQPADNNMQWDFWTLSPESAHMVTWLMATGACQDMAQHERLLQPHLHVDQCRGREVLVKYHFKTDQGVEHLTEAEGHEIAGQDPDHHIKDLYEPSSPATTRHGRCTCR